ncbi:MAG: hypothetical protein V7L05_10475 [Nostoc sp.]|uniref:hypothetical protein n=1 Tax=Nostoc sp. TaxID=1180 RepID=UPI002FFB3671
MPNAQCPMPNAQCPMPNAPCPMPKVSEISFRYNLSVQHDPIISLIYHQKLRRSRLSIHKREWDDEDTVGNLK